MVAVGSTVIEREQAFGIEAAIKKSQSDKRIDEQTTTDQSFACSGFIPSSVFSRLWMSRRRRDYRLEHRDRYLLLLPESLVPRRSAASACQMENGSCF